MNIKLSLLLVVLTAQFLIAPLADAQIYRYKDEYGRWQYSDRPPEGEQKVEKMGAKNSTSPNSSKTETPEDLVTHFEEKYSPRTAVERTTLAVVKVKTSLGTGSGFFVSDDGYLVTNKHVVRPTENKSWKEAAESYDEAKQNIERAEQQLKKRKAKIDKMGRDLDQYKKDIERYADKDKQVAMSEYEVYLDRWNQMKRDYSRVKKDVDEKKRELKSSNYSFSNKTAKAKFATQFEIILKDGSEHRAKLVELSKEHDLALLKLDGFSTPSLDVKSAGRAFQGMKVYAMGSPLGHKDFVTSGIITRAHSDQIVTDTQILPGNSGGPLTDEEGKVLGVNTQKLLSTKSIGSEGFGIAIPIKYVRQEFGDYLP